MAWLTIQTWLLLLIAFLLGCIAAWLAAHLFASAPTPESSDRATDHETTADQPPPRPRADASPSTDTSKTSESPADADSADSTDSSADHEETSEQPPPRPRVDASRRSDSEVD